MLDPKDSLLTKSFNSQLDQDALLKEFEKKLMKMPKMVNESVGDSKRFNFQTAFLDADIRATVNQTNSGSILKCQVVYNLRIGTFIAWTIVWFFILLVTAIIPTLSALKQRKQIEEIVKIALDATTSEKSLKQDSSANIEEKLRKLESLFKSKVIDEEEYQMKRKQVISELEL